MLEEQRCESNCPAQSDFSPKIRWRTRKKKRSSLNFGPNFRPKSGDEQKKKVFPQIWSDFLFKTKKKHSEHSFCVIKPYAQLAKGGAMPQFCLLFSANLQSWWPKGGAPWHNAPPKYAPGLKAQTRPEKFKSLRGWSIELGICAKDKEIPKT